MKKGNHLKALYHFTKKQKNKHSASTKDLNDSLDFAARPPNCEKEGADKNNHYRTQSCPPVEPLVLEGQIDIKIGNSQVSDKEDTTRIHESKFKRGHRNCKSQAEIESLSGNQMSVSIENLTSILYRKNSKESILKKSRVAGGGKFKSYAVEREHYERVKLDQQMKRYELNQELAELDKRTKGIAMKQQILESLLGKLDSDSVAGSSQELILP